MNALNRINPVRQRSQPLAEGGRRPGKVMVCSAEPKLGADTGAGSTQGPRLNQLLSVPALVGASIFN
jgi:hypothetical protein